MEKEKRNRCLCRIQTDDCCISLQINHNRTFIVKKGPPPALSPNNCAAALDSIARGVLSRISVRQDFLQHDYWPRNGRNPSWGGDAVRSHFLSLCGVAGFLETACRPKKFQYLRVAILVAGSWGMQHLQRACRGHVGCLKGGSEDEVRGILNEFSQPTGSYVETCTSFGGSYLFMGTDLSKFWYKNEGRIGRLCFS
jgi:hypothetical protein